MMMVSPVFTCVLLMLPQEELAGAEYSARRASDIDELPRRLRLACKAHHRDRQQVCLGYHFPGNASVVDDDDAAAAVDTGLWPQASTTKADARLCVHTARALQNAELWERVPARKWIQQFECESVQCANVLYAHVEKVFLPPSLSPPFPPSLPPNRPPALSLTCIRKT